MLAQARHFSLDGAPVACAPYGSGHINETYLLTTDRAHRYIIQRINQHVFRDVPGLMRNIELVTAYLRQSEPDPRRVLTLVRTNDGKTYRQDALGAVRAYEFVERSVCLDRAKSPSDMRQCGVAFGQFQRQLAGFPAETLAETIPHFHDTPHRYQSLREAVAQDACGRLKTVSAEVDFALAREREAGCLIEALRLGELPLRVTHNDTKLNNVMLDEASKTPLCVIDLDTVMPGLAGHDFGDTIRSGANTAPEDERDASRVSLSLPMYEAYVEGFLGVCGASLTKLERETLPMGAKLMTLECGVRFLTDYLAGDTYFRVNRPGQNLDRARTQLALVADMEKQWAAMEKIVALHG